MTDRIRGEKEGHLTPVQRLVHDTGKSPSNYSESQKGDRPKI